MMPTEQRAHAELARSHPDREQPFEARGHSGVIDDGLYGGEGTDPVHGTPPSRATIVAFGAARPRWRRGRPGAANR